MPFEQRDDLPNVASFAMWFAIGWIQTSQQWFDREVRQLNRHSEMAIQPAT